MFRKVLGWIFNRWVLIAVLVLAMLGVLWLVGPMVAIGDWRPLDSERARWLTRGVLLFIVAAIIGWQIWRAKRGNAKVVDQLMAAPRWRPGQNTRQCRPGGGAPTF